MSNSHTLAFEPELRATFLTLRAALQDLFSAVQADPLSPYPLSRRLGLDKTLVWKACRVLQSEDAANGVPFVPGRAGIRILLEGFRSGGAAEADIAKVDAAAKTLEGVVRKHSGDRATLALMLDGMRSEETLEKSRKLAFRGNSGVFGVQTRVRYSAYILAPNEKDPERVDVAGLFGFQRLQRLRPKLSWPLLRMRSFEKVGPKAYQRSREPLCAPASSVESERALPFLPEFCTNPRPALRKLASDGAVLYELLPGAVGREGALDLFFGDVDRSLGVRWCDDENDWVEMRAEIHVPSEHLQIDLLIHEDLTLGSEPRFQLAARLFRELPEPGDGSGLHDIPSATSVVALGRGAAEIASPHLPQGPRLFRFAFQRLGWNPAAFRGYRASLDYPPFGTTALLRFRMSPRAGGAG